MFKSSNCFFLDLSGFSLWYASGVFRCGVVMTFSSSLGVRTDPDLRGVIPNSFDHMFTHISRTHDQQFLVRASYLEIYQVNFVFVNQENKCLFREVFKRSRKPQIIARFCLHLKLPLCFLTLNVCLLLSLLK